MQYEAKDFSSLIGIEGLSENLLSNHFVLYQGYVKNTNLIMQNNISQAKDTVEFAELKRRFGWEFNGMRLHELYFENLSKSPEPIENYPDVFNKVQLDFGSIEKWQEDFKAMGMMRGIGWVVLYHDRWDDHFFNTWISEHDAGHLAGCRPLIVMDVFEHAFMPDGLRRPDYVDNIIQSLNWSSADERMKAIA